MNQLLMVMKIPLELREMTTRTWNPLKYLLRIIKYNIIDKAATR